MPCPEHPSCRTARMTSHLLPGTQYADLQDIKNTTAILKVYLPFYTQHAKRSCYMLNK